MSTSHVNDQVTVDFLEDFLDAWNRHDIEGILQLLDGDCLYISGDGARARGHDEIRELLSSFLTRFPDAHWRDATHFVAGEHGASEWTFTGTDSGGNRVKLDACDLFTFQNGRIALVSAYRRNRP